jgi:hypothetical protein
MRKAKFSETQIVAILKDAESGVPAADLLRKHGVSRAVTWCSGGDRSRLIARAARDHPPLATVGE